MRLCRRGHRCLWLGFFLITGFAQQAQNPSPMVEHTRAHDRLKEETLPGRRDVWPNASVDRGAIVLT